MKKEGCAEGNSYEDHDPANAVQNCAVNVTWNTNFVCNSLHKKRLIRFVPATGYARNFVINVFIRRLQNV